MKNRMWTVVQGAVAKALGDTPPAPPRDRREAVDPPSSFLPPLDWTAPSTGGVTPPSEWTAPSTGGVEFPAPSSPDHPSW